MRNFNISFVAVIIWILLCFSVMAKTNSDDEYKLPEQNIASANIAAKINCGASETAINGCLRLTGQKLTNSRMR
ncbi:MAG TPA: hypothetical protein VES38_11435 [Methylotenera sp.]|nr:hypothetical protein [Methylotenera sp.]